MRGRNAYIILVEKSQGNRVVGRLQRRWKDTIKTDIKKIECAGGEWIQLSEI
jgi:hypothetical protein